MMTRGRGKQKKIINSTMWKIGETKIDKSKTDKSFRKKLKK